MTTLATFNVKDLFDPTFEEKLVEIARRIASADPDVIALEEVGSMDALARIIGKLPRGKEYAPPIAGEGDRRGIRNVILSRLPVIHAQLHTAERLGFPVLVRGDANPYGDRIPLRRGIPHVKVDAGALGSIDVFAVHFKSKLPIFEKLADGSEVTPVTTREIAECETRSMVHRAAEALFVRGLLDQALAENPNVALMGDLNDVEGSTPLTIVKGRLEGAFVSASANVPEASRFSAMHGARREQIDHILVSRALSEKLRDAAFLNEELRDHPWPVEGTPPTADSDHALFWAKFEA